MGVESKGVTTIFKILVGTIVVVVLTSVLVEFFNITLTSTFVRGIITKSIEKSCDFFAQETYIRDEGGTSVDKTVYNIVEPIKFKDGSVAVSADFFGTASTQEEIYSKLYGKSSEFRTFIKENSKYWSNLRRLGYGIVTKYGGGNGLNVDNLHITYEYDRTAGKTYVDTHVTALNSGITYLDRETLETIARWNMVSNFYGGNPDMLVEGDTVIMGNNGGNADDYDYVLYDGYKIYFNTLNITDIDYDVYDLTTTSGAEGFASRTNVGDIDYWKNTVGLDGSDERKYVCVADVKYSINVSYDGITPIKKIMQYMVRSNNKMQERASGGMGIIDEYSSLNRNEEISDSVVNTDFIYRKNAGEAQMGSNNDYDLIDFNGKVTYYIVR